MKSKIIKIVSILWLASLLSSVLSFFTQIIVARNLSVNDYGLFSSSLGTVTLLTPLVGFGIAPFWLKIFGEEGWEAKRWLKASLNFLMFSGVSVFLIVVGWSFLGPHDNESRYLLIVLSGFIFSQAIVELIVAKYQLEENYLGLTLWQFIPQLLRFLAVFLVTLFIYSLTPLDYAIVYGSISFLFFISGWVLIRKGVKSGFSVKNHEKNNRLERNENISIADIFKEIWPFGLAGTFYLIYFQSSLILLKYLDGNISAGLFGVIFLILQAVYIFPAVVFQKFLMPKIHRWAYEENEKITNIYLKGNKLMFITGVGAMVMVWIVSPYFIPFFFGNEYKESIIPLMVIAVSIPLRFISTCSGSLLATKDNMRRRVSCMKWAVILNLVFNVISIPILGIYGAVLSAIVCDFYILLSYRYSVRKFVLKI